MMSIIATSNMTQVAKAAVLGKVTFTRLKAQGKRCIQLDALRGLAMLLVLFHHMFALPSAIPAGPVRAVLQTLKDNGWIGVDLFFVLSGFLVSGLLFEEFKRQGSLNIGRFLARRAFKIYPAYYCFVALGFAFLTLFGSEKATAILPAMSLFYSNYVMANFDAASNAVWMHGWSLAVEEHFYLLLAGLLWCLTRSPKWLKLTPIICVIVCLATLGMREFTFQNYPDWTSARFATHLKIDALMFGVLLSYYYYFHRNAVEKIFRFREKLFLPLALLLIAPCALWGFAGHFAYVIGFTTLYLGCGIALLTWIVNPLNPSTVTRMLASMGAFSYSIYLWHRVPQLMIEALIPAHTEFYLVKLVLYFACSIVGGVLMAKVIELPSLALRDKFVPSVSNHEFISKPNWVSTIAQFFASPLKT